VKERVSDQDGSGMAEAPDSTVRMLHGWQERAVERRLSNARARALVRSSRFLATALELVQESARADFTVQDLVDRSNLSLRAFYQHFTGKDELLLALFEDVTSQFTEDIRQEVDAADGPVAKLEAFCRGFVSRSESSKTLGGRIVTIYNVSLEIEHPAQFAKVWEPQKKLLEKILTQCARAGLVRKDLTPAQLTLLLTSTLFALAQFSMLNADAKVLLDEDDMWAWCRQAVGASVNEAQTSTARNSARGTKKQTGSPSRKR
jgi:AcrR family transcriptional regulator